MKNYADFMMILSPGEGIKVKVQQYKLNAAKVIGAYDGTHAIAHISITLMPRQKAFLTEPVVINLGKYLSNLPPVTLTVDGFDYFNHGEDYKTIYAKIRSTPATAQWFKMLKKYLNIREFMVPHISIARNIPVSDFNLLWPYFAAIKWTESFTVNELTVLQREAFTPAAVWEVFAKLPFESKEAITVMPVKHSMLMPVNQQHNRQISLF